MWEILIRLAEQSSPLFAPLFVLSVSVNVYQYKLNNTIQEKRLSDWQTALNLANKLAEANQKIQESLTIMVQGLDKGMQRLLDKENLS